MSTRAEALPASHLRQGFGGNADLRQGFGGNAGHPGLDERAAPQSLVADEWWRVPGAAVAGDGATSSRIAFGALVAFTAILLLSPQIWFPILGTLRIAFVAACLSIGAHLLDRIVRRDAAPPAAPEFVIAFLLVSWAVITVPVAYWAAGSVELITEQYLKAVAFFWLIGTLATTTSRLRVFCWTLVLCSIPLAVTGIKNYLTGEFLITSTGVTRIEGYWGGSGIAGNPNDLALMLNLTIPIAAALMIGTRSLAGRALAAGAMLLAIAGVVVTFSRAGFLTLAAIGVLLFAVLVRRRSNGAAALLVVVAIAAPAFTPAEYVDRLSTITNFERDTTGSAQGRWQDFLVASDVVMGNPMIGVGVGNDMLALNEARGFDTWRSVHNAYLQYAVDLALPGLLLFVALHLMCFRSARAVERRAALDPAVSHLGPLAAGVQVSLAAFFVAAMFHPIAYQFYFFTIAGVAVALKNTWLSNRSDRAERPERSERMMS
jgi:probable O-glycosylation ligase (exosortase A-associated)